MKLRLKPELSRVWRRVIIGGLLVLCIFNSLPPLRAAAQSERLNNNPIAARIQPDQAAVQSTATPTWDNLQSGSTATAPPNPSIFKKKPTRTPRPTHTPVPIPPPSDPGDARWMVVLSLLMIGIVLITVWLNRKRIQ